MKRPTSPHSGTITGPAFRGHSATHRAGAETSTQKLDPYVGHPSI
jgi:glutamine amidotransferase-like uncharacterized protein